jgi:hypothetical protein
MTPTETASHELVEASRSTRRPEDVPLRLPVGRTEAEALIVARKHHELIWHGAAGKGLTEDQRIDLLNKTCTEMCCGHKPSGKRLATKAIWTP